MHALQGIFLLLYGFGSVIKLLTLLDVLNIYSQGKNMKVNLTAVFRKSPHGYVGYVEELPGANTQGMTLEEAKANLVEAVQLVLESNRQLSEEEVTEQEIIKEPFGILST